MGELVESLSVPKSTYDTQNLPQNFGIGHGWVEGGPLLPVKTELYQSGLGAQALHDLGNLAHLLGKEDVSKEFGQDFASHKALVNQAFWSAEKSLFSVALDRNNQRVETPSVLATVPMWFGLLDEAKSEATINLLADSDHQTDWGMRIISSRDPKYNPGGYHFGSVWPLFTGWAAVGEYHYHRALPAYSNLRANALLAWEGSLGHVTEVLSGDYHQSLSTSSPHQVWSASRFRAARTACACGCTTILDWPILLNCLRSRAPAKACGWFRRVGARRWTRLRWMWRGGRDRFTNWDYGIQNR